MKDEIRKRGYLLEEDLRPEMIPQGERLTSAPFALIECVENIPCNPCETSCPKNAITIGENITDLPRIDFSLCTGCGICLVKCPGLAIFIADLSQSSDFALISIPWEFLPLPQVGSKIKGIDRAGKVVCDGEIAKVRKMPKDKTHIVTARVPRKYFNQVRHFQIVEEE